MVGILLPLEPPHFIDKFELKITLVVHHLPIFMSEKGEQCTAFYIIARKARSH